MAFNPTSDVVLEVLNAADPARASMAAERLAALAAGAAARDFTVDLDKAAATATPAPPLEPGLADARSAFSGSTDATDPTVRAKVEFEAMALSSFVGEMLPEESSAFFGQGTAGDVWRSMLGEQIARQIAKSGALGLSRRLFATHELAAGEPRNGAMTAATAVGSSANILSAPAGAEIASGAVLSAARKRA